MKIRLVRLSSCRIGTSIFLEKTEDKKSNRYKGIATHQSQVYCFRLSFSFVEAAITQYLLLSLNT